MESRISINKTKRESRRRRKKFLIIGFLFLFIFLDFVWIMNNERFKITEVKIEGNRTILNADIQNVINEYFDTKIIFLFPKDNVLLTNTKNIEDKIKNKFPKIYNADIVIKDGSWLSVLLEEREPHSLWCKNENYESDFDEECYFADQRGFIYARAPYFSGGVFEKIYTTTELLQIGEQVSGKEEFLEFFEFTDYLLNEYGVVVDHVFLNERDEVKIFIKSFNGQNFSERPYIIYNYNDTYETIGQNIGLMVNHDLFKKEFKDNPERLEYIDARISDQIRYKFTPAGEPFGGFKKINDEITEKTEE